VLFSKQTCLESHPLYIILQTGWPNASHQVISVTTFPDHLTAASPTVTKKLIHTLPVSLLK